ncbi:MAG: RNA polymerase factor sigma-54 [Gammaproteobacteria bacterium]|nr:RNA polymerase factor sigma-54 [Gammaproteobacteria bacterium]
MKQSLQLRLGQQLAMTPQLQQAIRLLQLSTLELNTEVQEALDSNLMLEVDEEDDEAGARPADGNGQDRDSDVEMVDIPNDLPVDGVWEDIYDSIPAYSNGSGGSEFPDNDVQRSATETLADYLFWQMSLTHFSEIDGAIGAAIIDAVDDDGYLRLSIEEVQETLAAQMVEVGLDEIEAVLHQVQNFDPVGVAARDLRECLMRQLQQIPEENRWQREAAELVNKHLQLLASRDYAQLKKVMKLDEDALKQVIYLIQSLNPRPGSQIQPAPAEYVIPDVFVRKQNGVWRVELNSDAFPRLRVNSHYARLMRRSEKGADKDCLKSHLQEARWFIKSLKSRNDTLLKVAKTIVERQQGFLEYGEEAMKPMVLHDVAQEVEMHESTISRVTTRKYMHTPRGIFELKFFFSSHVYTKSGAECSSTAIRALLKKLIAAENSSRPLSDSKLAAILSEQGIKVARRTVAKYREAMAIPSSTERRSLT